MILQALQEEIIHLRVQLALLQSQLASENENKLKKEMLPARENENDCSAEVVQGNDGIENIIDNGSDIVSYVDDLADETELDINTSDFMKHSTAKYVKTSTIDLQTSKDLSHAAKILGM